MRRLSIQTKLSLALCAILLAAFSLVSLLNYHASRQAVREELMTTMPMAGESIYSTIHSTLLKPMFVSSLMANDAFVKEWARDGEQNHEAILRYLRDIHDKYEFFSVFFVSAISNRYYHNDGVLKKVSGEDKHDGWFFSFLDSGVEYELNVDTNEAEQNRLTIFINYRVEDYNGHILGATGVGLNIDRMAQVLDKARRQYKRLVYLVDPLGIVQAHPDISLIHKESLFDRNGTADIAAEILTPRDEPASFEFDENGKHYLLSVLYMPDLGWHLVVEHDEAQSLAPARRNLYRTLGMGLLVSALVIPLTVLTVNRFNAKLVHMARTDGLTGTANRRAFESEFSKSLARFNRSSVPFSVILLDLDHLKEINDTLGHLEGDKAICRLADIILTNIRGTDTVARWGGDEFGILVEGSHTDAMQAAERIRMAVAETSGPSLSVSMGVAKYKEGDILDSLLSRADTALYLSKQAGGNTITGPDALPDA